MCTSNEEGSLVHALLLCGYNNGVGLWMCKKKIAYRYTLSAVAS